MRKFLLPALSLVLLCCSDSRGPQHEDPVSGEKPLVRYARGFTIEYSGGNKLVKVFPAFGSNGKALFSYLLIPRGSKKPETGPETTVIEVPVKSVVCLSSLYISYLDRLGLLSSLKGIDNFRYINSPGVISLVEQGKVQEVGSDGSLNIEKVIDLNPELVFTYVQGKVKFDTHPKLNEAGIPVAGAVDQLETTPLGRAEWIRFIAAFYDKDREADSIFSITARNYEKLAEMSRGTGNKPTVFTGIKYDAWYMPGGKSYMAELLKDAGGSYLWEDDSSSGSIRLSFEQVLDKAKNADYWINSGAWNSLGEALQHDSRNREFKAFKEKMIYNNNKRVNKHGGNDYWETGLLNPDLLLSDLISIFHPDLLPGHELIYYKKLDK